VESATRTPGSLVIVSGDQQSGSNNQTLERPLVVRVLATDGAPMQGVRVSWTTNNGQVQPSAAVTNSSGEVQAQWTLGPGNPHNPRYAWAEVDGLPRVQFVVTIKE
jgi:hypothetical protein